ncbi:ribonuclease H-like domain-containing protein [Halostagnicola kamekurae]|uniref:RecB family nuclease, putative, TM0106 family n=1 Tax=Halostagnicola kamekurae TaxID=619731 RepID=A0A1I6QVW2_9EURY|nr:ribonuclease H-like domain-containing protein [Halostagnicola kamekurae]SFS56566.1 RecB family nuclease, putative, TM0106 family [Halostagnicola kamekurae]
MSNRGGSRVLSISPEVLSSQSLAALRDARDHFDPDLVLVPGPSRAPQADARARHVFEVPVVHPPLTDAAEPVRRHDIGATSLLTARGADALVDAEPAPERRLETDASIAAVVCDDVTTTVRPTALETDLARRSELSAALPAGETTTVLTGGLAAGYDERWRLAADDGAVVGVGVDGGNSKTESTVDTTIAVRIVGIGSREGYGSAGSLSSIAVGAGPDGGLENRSVGPIETLAADEFGLEAVSGVGPKTVDKLEGRGVTSRADLLETSIETLASMPGIGRQTAVRMREHATVLESGAPRRLSDEPLPAADRPRPPLCLDIETDGLSPTIIWQIGAYDPATDEYHAFVERSDPTDPSAVLESFCDWLFGVHPDRALLTWNGWRFDYRHLESFLTRYVPRYLDAWDNVPKLDLYGWAVGDDNAVLPGRTNALEDVSAALGYEGTATGLDGARTAAAYQRFIRTGSELEWDRHEAYCEDDCRALWHVYERLRDVPTAAELAGTAGEDEIATTNDRSRGGSQTGLGDF